MRRLLLAVLLLFGSTLFAQTTDLSQRARAALSQTSGTLKAPGLQQPVSVLRDRWGVPHIYARNQHDLFFAQGFVVAQDRLFQMELWKRSGQGRLAEILGPGAVQRDIYARLLRYRGDMAAEYAGYAPDARAILTAFTDGINAYIASRRGDWPLEFQLAGFAPEPWKPEDCLNRMAAFSMASNAKRELYNAMLVQALGAKKAAALLDLDPPVDLTPPPGADYAGLSDHLLDQLVGSDARIEFPAQAGAQAASVFDLSTDTDEVGSNNWTISGKHTTTGKPILANDPHRTIAVPSLRYVVHLVAPGWDVIGATEPGLPGVADGHNQRIAWGFTIFGIDQQDLYLEKLDPKDPLRYKTERGWETMRTEREVVRVKGAPARDVTLKFTRHGPVLWEDGTRALALRWVGAEPGAAGYLAALSLDRAQNWQEFLAAMTRWKLPSENMVYADVDGNIGEQSAGLAPVREHAGKRWEGELPVPGDGGYEWSGWVPLARQPHFFNPANGYVATANAKIIPGDYGEYGQFEVVGHEWAPRDRVMRIEEVLKDATQSGQKLSVADSQRLQGDVTSLAAASFGSLLYEMGAHAVPALDILEHWDGKLTADSAQAALYELWMRRFREAALHAAVPATLWRDVRLSNSGVLSCLKNVTCTMSPAARDKLVTDSATTASADLKQLQGDDPKRWAWGKLHTVRFRHPLDSLPGVAAVMDLGPLPRPGDGTTVCATGMGANFQQVAGASYREIFDLSDWDNSTAVNAPGQSGQPGSPHYSDLVDMWSKTEYFPLAYSRQAVDKVTADRLELEP